MTEFITPPPIGLRPRFITNRARIQEFLEALLRYNAAGELLPKDWLRELITCAKDQYFLERRHHDRTK